MFFSRTLRLDDEPPSLTHNLRFDDFILNARHRPTTIYNYRLLIDVMNNAALLRALTHYVCIGIERVLSSSFRPLTAIDTMCNIIKKKNIWNPCTHCILWRILLAFRIMEQHIMPGTNGIGIMTHRWFVLTTISNKPMRKGIERQRKLNQTKRFWYDLLAVQNGIERTTIRTFVIVPFRLVALFVPAKPFFSVVFISANGSANDLAKKNI